MEYQIVRPDELYHHGILGMRWGVRRFQRKDGTWTNAGKKRREMSPDAQKRAERKNEIRNLKSKGELDSAKAAYKINKAENRKALQKAKAGVETVGSKLKTKAKEIAENRKEKKKAEANEDIVRSGDMKKILANKGKLSDDELATAVRRMQLEQQLSAVDAQKKQDAINTYRRFADVVGTTANLTANGINTYNNIAKVINTFTDKELRIVGQNNRQSEYDRRMNAARLRTAEAAAENAELNLQRNRGQGQSTSNQTQTTSSNQPHGSSSGSHSGRQASADRTRTRSEEPSQESSSQPSSSPTLRDRLRSGVQAHREASAERRAQQEARRWTQEAQDNASEQAQIAGRTHNRLIQLRQRVAQEQGTDSAAYREVERAEVAAQTIAQYRANNLAEIRSQNPTGRTVGSSVSATASNALNRVRNITLTREARRAARETGEYRARQAQERLDDAFQTIGTVDIDELERRYGGNN